MDCQMRAEMADSDVSTAQEHSHTRKSHSKSAVAWRNALAKVQSDQPAAGAQGKPPASTIIQHVEKAPRRQFSATQCLPAAAAPRLALMILAASNLPGSSSKELQRLSMFVKAVVHRHGQAATAGNKQKTHLTLQINGCAAWNSLLTFSVDEPQDMMLTLSLRHQRRAFNKTVLWGHTCVCLGDVLADPASWGGRQQLLLGGQRLQGMGAVLEVQLFLSTERIQGPLSVLAATWNVGNALPPPPGVLLTSWLKGVQEGQHHLVAVGAQECNYSREPRKAVSRRQNSVAELAVAERAAAAIASETGALAPAALDHLLLGNMNTKLKGTRARFKDYLLEQVDSAAAWERHMAAALGQRYWLLCSKHMFQTRLLLFARVDVVPFINRITAGFEATGIGRVGLNKGGVAVSLMLDNTRLAFICSHLAAHQGKTAQRNADVAEICAGLRLHAGSAAGAPGCDIVTGFHHVVWMGDLNYRLEYGQQAITHSESPTAEDFAALCADITAGKTLQLLETDQLLREQKAGHVFAGFGEGQINFAPTFKVLKGEPGSSYTAKRSPAWCDRVLFKSALTHKQATCSSYFAAADITTSDHKPVAAELLLPIITDTVTPGRPTDRVPFKLYVASVKLEGSGSWQWLRALLLGPAATTATTAEVAGGSDCEKSKSPAKQRQRGLSRRRKLRLVLAGACLAGLKQEHVFKVNGDAVTNGVSAAAAGPVCPEKAVDVTTPTDSSSLNASLLQREENMALLPGALQDLQDDWLLLRLELVDGLKCRTMARGIVPLHSAVAEYQTHSFKPVQVQVHLECNSAAAGTALISLQLISSQTARQGMHEAIRRMRALAHLRSRSATQAGSSRCNSGQAWLVTKPNTWLGASWLMESYAKVVEGITPLKKATSLPGTAV